MKFLSLIVALLFVLSGTAFASQVIRLDPRTEPETRVSHSALVFGENSGKQCLIRLEPRGIVRRAAACAWNDALKRTRFWRRNANTIFFYETDRILIAFEAISADTFRAAGAVPEGLQLRLIPAASVPMTK